MCLGKPHLGKPCSEKLISIDKFQYSLYSFCNVKSKCDDEASKVKSGQSAFCRFQLVCGSQPGTF